MIVIDDDPSMGKLVEVIAQTFGFDVSVTENPEEFMKLYSQHEPTIIVMDIVMPDKDGIELLDWLGKRNCAVPIVLISGYGDKYIHMASNIAAAQKIKVVGALSKPFDIEKLEVILQQVLDAAAA